MIKRYYQGLLSIRYSALLVGGALLVFLCAFLDIKHPDTFYKYLLIISAVILLFIMFIYYSNKIRIYKDIKAIDNIDRYLDAKMIGTSFILEDTLVIGNKEGIKEYKNADITSITTVENRKPTILIKALDNNFLMEANSLEELEKFAAFIKRKNPDVELNGLEAKGSGLLKDLIKK